jgi:hypothetical protein
MTTGEELVESPSVGDGGGRNDATEIFESGQTMHHHGASWGQKRDLILINCYSNLLGTHNPEWLGIVNIVLGIILGWNSLYHLRLAKVEEERSGVRVARAKRYAYT